MTDFIRTPSEYDNIPKFLTEEAIGFQESKEFKALDTQDSKFSGVICAAFTKYFLRLQEEALRKISEQKIHDELETCYATIERLASSRSPKVENLVVVEIFENFHCSDEMLNEIKKHLQPNSLKLYKRWAQ
jgi:hypothetical protein